MWGTVSGTAVWINAKANMNDEARMVLPRLGNVEINPKSEERWLTRSRGEHGGRGFNHVDRIYRICRISTARQIGVQGLSALLGARSVLVNGRCWGRTTVNSCGKVGSVTSCN